MATKYHWRLAQTADSSAILAIIEQAKELLKQTGSPQWQDGYPNQATILADIALKQAYVLCDEAKIIATIAIKLLEEETYQKIYGGAWKYTGSYASLHRIAIDQNYAGKNIGTLLIQAAEQQLRSQHIAVARVDTHYLNKRAISLFLKNQYEYAGVIFLQAEFVEKQARLAYEKRL